MKPLRPFPSHPPGFSPRTAWPPAAYRALADAARSSDPLELSGAPGAAFEAAAREVHRLCRRNADLFLRMDLSLISRQDRMRASALAVPPGGTLFLLHAELLVAPPPRPAPGLVAARETLHLQDGTFQGEGGKHRIKPPWRSVRIPHVREYPRLERCIQAAWRDWAGKPLAKMIADSLSILPYQGGETELLAILLKAAPLGTAPLLEYLSMAGNPSLSGHATWKNRKRLLERALVEQALGESGGNQSQAARLLGVHRNTLLWHLKRFRTRLDAQPPQK